jgi:hypothetical protein
MGLLLFAQFSIAFGGCMMDRAEMQVLQQDSHPCDDCGAMNDGGQSMVTSACVSHCTADLQQPAAPVIWATAPVSVRVLLIPDVTDAPGRPPDVDVSPNIAPPRRILLHSFLI